MGNSEVGISPCMNSLILPASQVQISQRFILRRRVEDATLRILASQLGFHTWLVQTFLSSGDFELIAIEIPEAWKGISETLAKTGFEDWGGMHHADGIWGFRRTEQNCVDQ